MLSYDSACKQDQMTLGLAYESMLTVELLKTRVARSHRREELRDKV